MDIAHASVIRAFLRLIRIDYEAHHGEISLFLSQLWVAWLGLRLYRFPL